MRQVSAKPWTAAEKAIVKKIVEGKLSLRKNMHLLPGRPYCTAKEKAAAYRPGSNRVELVVGILADGVPRTSKQIAKELNLERKSISDALRHIVEPGDTQRAHICGVTDGKPCNIYVIGQGANIETGAARPKGPRLEKSDAELDRIYRSGAYWWPDADSVVINSINAMVNAGRAQA